MSGYSGGVGPSETIEQIIYNSRLRAMDVGALNFSPHLSEKQDDGDKPELTVTLWGNH
jgi:hypothetical protein